MNVPTTGMIRQAYTGEPCGDDTCTSGPVKNAEFDAWLAGHGWQVAGRAGAQALRDAADDVERIDPEWDSALCIDGTYNPVPDWLRARADALAPRPAAPGVSVSALLAVRDEITERCLRARHAETFGNHSYRYEATRCDACTETIQSIEAVVATITDDFRRRGCVCGPGKRCARHDLGVTVTDGGA